MINWQFFATAGVVSGVLLLVAIIIDIIGCDYLATLRGYDDTLKLIAKIIYIVVAVFWFIMGIISSLNFIWGWGLIV